MEPAFTFSPGVFATTAVVSVCPYPSRMVRPQLSSTFRTTSGFSGSPALTTSRNFTAYLRKSSLTSILQAVGGAQRVVTPKRTNRSSVLEGLNRVSFVARMHAPAFHGAKNELQACFAQPGELMFQCRSPGLMPIQYIVARWPTG